MQGYEDYLRHKADKEVNYKQCLIVRESQLVQVNAKDIRVQFTSEFMCNVLALKIYTENKVKSIFN